MRGNLLLMTAFAMALAFSLRAADDPERMRPHKDCEGCHMNHAGAQETPLLVTSDPERLCGRCHEPGGARSREGRIDRPLWLAAPPKSFASRHVGLDAGDQKRRGGKKAKRGAERGERGLAGGCVACHAPHISSWAGEGPTKTLSERAFSADGRRIPGRPATVAEVCFGCHASPIRGRAIIDPMMVGPLFSPDARSSHRIGSEGRADLPSLRGTKLRQPMDCVSCHTSQAEVGMRGPHVSRFPHLLAAAYQDMDGVPENPEQYALCYACHDRQSILANESFPLHRAHITGAFSPLARPDPRPRPMERFGAAPGTNRREGAPTAPTVPKTPRAMSRMTVPTSCSTCHDPHGSLESDSLVRFDPMVVFPNDMGLLEYRSISSREGSCDLECHGHQHRDARY